MDKRSETSAENGKKGGRPVSEATLRAQMARDYISKQMEDSLAPIVAKAITQAIEGSSDARNWLSDRAWGKALQSIDHTTDGKALPTPILGHVPAYNSDQEGSEPQEAN